jgi:hypothetical protein
MVSQEELSDLIQASRFDLNADPGGPISKMEAAIGEVFAKLDRLKDANLLLLKSEALVRQKDELIRDCADQIQLLVATRKRMEDSLKAADDLNAAAEKAIVEIGLKASRHNTPGVFEHLHTLSQARKGYEQAIWKPTTYENEPK